MRALRWLIVFFCVLVLLFESAVDDRVAADASPTIEALPTVEATTPPPPPEPTQTTETPTHTPVPPATQTAVPTGTAPPLEIVQEAPTLQAAAGSLTFHPAADARVEAAQPSINFGLDPLLRVISSANAVAITYLRFSVNGLNAPPDAATLAMWVTTGTSNGPAVHPCADASWPETEITWANMPAVGMPGDDKDAYRPIPG